jgi:hypothetical protein
MQDEGDSTILLKAIKALVYNFRVKNTELLPSMMTCMPQFYMIYQEKEMSCQVYLEKFQNCADALENTDCGGSSGKVPGLVNMVLEDKMIDPNMATKYQIADPLKDAQEHQYLAVAFLCGSDCYQHGKLLKNLENNYTQGEDQYPKRVMAAYCLLTNWKQDPSLVHT